MANPIRRSALPVTDADLDQFEAESAVTSPADYRAFLLANNGGVPKANSFTYTRTTGKTRKAVLKAFFPLTPTAGSRRACRPSGPPANNSARGGRRSTRRSAGPRPT